MGLHTRYWKFYLIPGYREPDFSAREFEIGKFQSKRKFFSRLLNPLTIIGISLLLFIIFLAMFPPWLTIYTVEDLSISIFTGAFSPPSNDHPFGTTKYGWDVLGRLIWGARSSITVGLQAVFISVVLGVMIGTIAAYFCGIIDMIIMRFFDLIIAFPGMIILLLLITILGPTMTTIMTISGVLGIPGYARMMRAMVLKTKNERYIEAAIVSGAKDYKVMFKHILPNAVSPIIISLSFHLGGIVLMLSGLAFLGFSDPTLIDWGTDINIGRGKIFTAPWTFLYPGILIGITVLGFSLLGDGLRDALDPKLNK